MGMDMTCKMSIIMPARNEEEALGRLLPEIKALYPDAELIIVNDGSTDATERVARDHDAHVISHSYPMGNGAAVKSGARSATGEILLFMDADGQHLPEDIIKLMEKMEDGHDMVVGARTAKLHANPWRMFANIFYNKLASWITSHAIKDLTSGFRIVKADKFKEFLYMLPNGFSYPTTITMAFFRSGYLVDYVPIQLNQRTGNSHIRLISDGMKFLLIILRVGTLYSPLKIFLPISFMFFILGISNYIYTYVTESRFTNMSALLIIASIMIFLIGLVSEQITSLMYQRKD
jgi:glycosyltransferase involved in cell wall biosynthesis